MRAPGAVSGQRSSRALNCLIPACVTVECQRRGKTSPFKSKGGRHLTFTVHVEDNVTPQRDASVAVIGQSSVGNKMDGVIHLVCSSGFISPLNT